MQNYRETLKQIRTFPQLIKFLREELNWPINSDDFDELTFTYTPEELGIDSASAAQIQEIRRLRPLTANQPWGIFFVKFEPKQLPVVALRRILSRVVLKKRASANSSERGAWQAEDLLFISNYGEANERRISFAHFSHNPEKTDLPTLKVLGWDNLDTPLHLDAVADQLTHRLSWPEDNKDVSTWRTTWRSAFALQHREVIATSKELSIRLAELARAIRDRIKTALSIETKSGPLTTLMKAFQTALVHDLDADGFADMYAQTIAYGLLSARIADPAKRTTDDFAAHMRTNPFLRELMETFLKVGGRNGKAGGPGIDFDELGVSEVVDLLDNANMEAVVRDFGDRNPQEDPVIHFYELFLKEYDANKRMQRGVFYTPRPVVSYIVRSVDELLRNEFGLVDGLADTTTWGDMVKRNKDLKIPEGVSLDQDFVQILDPATGTGTFLVEVIDVIHKTLVTKWKAQGHGDKKINALWNDYVSKHLLTRLHGYELLMAPYAIAHLKIGLKLFETGYHFDAKERARIYLTNALENRNISTEYFELFLPALAHEAIAVNDVKSQQRFTVIIGNPPYNTVSKNMGDWIKDLVKVFRIVDGKTIEEKGKRNHLQDDYVKFFRLGLFQLENSGAGVCGLITNHSFLFSPTFRGMRYYIEHNTTAARFVDLNGNVKRSDSQHHLGDENVFEIQQGVAISLIWRLGPKQSSERLEYASIWGDRKSKYRVLSDSPTSILFKLLRPRPEFYLFEPTTGENRPIEYESWLQLDKAMPFGGTGIITNRDDFVIDFSDPPILKRMEVFRDHNISDVDAQNTLNLKENYTWKIPRIRRLFRSDSNHNHLRDIDYRLFDRRRIYYQKHVVYNPRFETMAQARPDNVFLLSCRQQFDPGFRHAFVTRQMFECCIVSAKSREKTYGFPLYVYGNNRDSELFNGQRRSLNFAVFVHSAFSQRHGVAIVDKPRAENSSEVTGADLFHYFYAILHSPSYRVRYEEYLKGDFPRLPLPRNLDIFCDLAKCGADLALCHLLEAAILNKPLALYTGPDNPLITRIGWSHNTIWIDSPGSKSSESKRAGTCGFSGVSEAIWNFRIGGYQVCEKWLKDRKGRTLSKDEIAHYQKIIVALSETIRLMKDIDEVIKKHGGWPGAFVTSDGFTRTSSSPLAMAAEDPTEYKTRNQKSEA